MYEIIINGELYHHGVKGQKWGRRKINRKINRNEKKHYRNMSESYLTKSRMSRLDEKKEKKEKKGKTLSNYEKKKEKLKNQYDNFMNKSKIYNKNISELTKISKDRGYKFTYKRKTVNSREFFDRSELSLLNGYNSSRYDINYDKTKLHEKESTRKSENKRKAEVYKTNKYTIKSGGVNINLLKSKKVADIK